VSLHAADPVLATAIAQETLRQELGLEMIASENYVSEAVMEAQGSVLTNKYAEGLPNRRYYGGCEYVDLAENLARQRAKELFGCERVNVQPHSGAQANMAVFLAALNPGDKLVGMSLSHGGHLTHGAHVNSSGQIYDAAQYGVDEATGLIDYDEVAAVVAQHQPKLLICGYSAYPRQLDFERFRAIADSVGALLMADIAHIAGLVATGQHPDPIPHCDFVTTTTHKTLRGPRGGMVMCRKDWGRPINQAVFPRMQGGPLMHVIAAKAVAFGEALKPEFKQYSQAVVDNAQALASGLLAGGLELVSGGTDNHLVLVSLLNRDVSGKDAEEALGRAHITVNKNTVPGETRSAMVTSGLRIGTPALTARGMGTAQMTQIAAWIVEVLSDPTNDALTARIAGEVHDLCVQYPIYPGRLADARALLAQD